MDLIWKKLDFFLVKFTCYSIKEAMKLKSFMIRFYFVTNIFAVHIKKK